MIITPELLISKWRLAEAQGEKNLIIRISEAEDVGQYCALGADSSIIFLVETRLKPNPYSALDTVSIDITKTPDGMWRHTFTLMFEEFLVEFAALTSAMARSVTGITSEALAIKKQQEAYEKWVLFYRRTRKFPLSAARGLFGELSAMKELADSRDISIGEVFTSWHGPQGGPQDFVFEGKQAVEVKTMQPSRNKVTISGTEQLDFPGSLELWIYRVSDGLNENQGSNLNTLVASVSTKLSTIQRHDFQQLLDLIGFDPENPICKERYFEAVSQDIYLVKDGFPKIKGVDLHPAIQHVEYELVTSHIEDFKLQK